MALSTILAAGTGSATSTDVVVLANGQKTVGLFVAEGEVPPRARATVVMETPGADVSIGQLVGGQPLVLSGPGTYKVVRQALAPITTAVGAYADNGEAA